MIELNFQWNTLSEEIRLIIGGMKIMFADYTVSVDTYILI